MSDTDSLMNDSVQPGSGVTSIYEDDMVEK
jgi:hypothetical protein